MDKENETIVPDSLNVYIGNDNFSKLSTLSTLSLPSTLPPPTNTPPLSPLATTTYPIQGWCGNYITNVRLTNPDSSKTLSTYPCVNNHFGGYIRPATINVTSVDVTEEAKLIPEGENLDLKKLDKESITIYIDTINPTFIDSITSTFFVNQNWQSPVGNNRITANSPLQYRVVFSEPVSDLPLSQIALSNAVITSMVKTSNTYNLTLTPLLSGLVTIQVKNLAVKDKAGNPTSLGTLKSIYFDGDGPTAPSSLTLGATPSALDQSPVITFTSGVDALSGWASDEIQLWQVDAINGDQLLKDWAVFVSGSALTSLTPPLASGQSYYVKLRSKDKLGNVSLTTTSTPWGAGVADDPTAVATLTGVPAVIDSATTLSVTVGGTGITHYRYKVGVAATTDCTIITGYSAEAIVATLITDSIAALPDATLLKICAIGSKVGGGINYQPLAAATSYTWTKDTTAPIATLTGAPTGTNNALLLNVDVGGTDVISYRYKISAGTNECSTALGYSSDISQILNITDSFAGFSDGPLYLCAIGKDTLGNEQSTLAATVVSWTKDTTAPIATLTGAPAGTSNTTSLNVDVGGTDVVNYKYKVGETATNDCTNPSGYSTATSEATNITSDISALGDVGITLCAIAADAAGNWQTEATATTATWTKFLLSYDATAVATLSGLPSSVDSRTTLNVTVGGTAITHYRYKLGVDASVDCSVIAGYSSELPIATLITDDLSSYTDGTKLKICAVGSKGGSDNNYQPLSSATTHSWTKDTVIEANITYLGESYNDANTAMSFVAEIPSTKPYDVILDYRTYGVATSATDHDLPLTGQVTIPAGQTTATVNFNLVRNVATNAEKTFNIQLIQSSKVGVAPGSFAYQFNSIKDVDGGNYSDVVTVDGGSSFSCGINSTGALKCWGANFYGRLGDGTTTNRKTPTPIDSGSKYTQISAGGSHSCGITTAGILKCWGYNAQGELGDGTTTQRTTPVVVDSGTTYSQISSGYSHSCGITTSGTLKCWGYNFQGQLGDGTTTQRSSPTVIQSGITYSKVAAGNNHTCAITTTGDLKCWGYNTNGQLGDGTTTQRTTPVLVNSGTPYTQITVGWNHTCGITSAGVLKCWGRNATYQIGDGTGIQRPNPTVIDSGTSYAGITAGHTHTCGITNSGILKCWGDNSYGQIGRFISFNLYSTPTVIDSATSYTGITAGHTHTCGITNSGTLKCWGDNSYGQIGDGTITNAPTPTLTDGGTSYSQIGGKFSATCGITTTGVLKCWGDEIFSGLGDGTINRRQNPTVIDPGTLYLQISEKSSHTCGISTTGTLKCWGNNGGGQLGDGTTTQRSTPAVIDSGTSYTQITTGGSHSCGITNTGTLKCWGFNSVGQLGDGSTTQKTKPLVIDSGTSYVEIAAGNSHSCGITISGSLKCWGSNFNGQIGDGTTTNRTSPTLIDSGTSYTKITAGDSHTCGLTSTGVLKCWGVNSSGQLGDGTTTQRNSPTLIDSGTNYRQLAAGYNQTCGTTTSDNLKCWGYNGNGQLGDGTTTQRNSPTLIDSGTNYTKISGGSEHTCGITTAGALKCWGSNGNGQLGDGSIPPPWLPHPIVGIRDVDNTPPTVTLTGAPTGTSNALALNVTVGGFDVFAYKYKLGNSGSTDCSVSTGYSGSIAISTTPTITTSLAALPDGSITLCAIGRDTAGNWQTEAAATIATWIKDTVTPIAILTGAPTGTSNTLTLNIDVGGTDVVSYRYKITEATNQCSSPLGYSSDTTEVLNITDTISALADGAIYLCVIGKDAAGNEQSTLAATVATWTKSLLSYDATAVATLSGLPSSIDPTTLLNVTVGGTDITHYRYKVGLEASTDCSVFAGYGSEFPIATLITDSLAGYTDGTRLKICAIGSKGGSNSNYQPLASATTHSWTKDTVIEANITYLGESYNDANTAMSFIAQIPSTKPYDVTLDYRSYGVATSAADHDLPLTGQVTIPAGQTTAPVNFNLLRNLTTNTEKTFNIQLTQSSKVGVAPGPLAYQFNSIKDVDGGPYTDLIYISTGESHTCGINSAGTLKCWGINTSGQIGDGTKTDRLIPTPIDSGTTYKVVSAGPLRTCGITVAGLLKCWGNNATGELGDGTTTEQLTPKLIDPGVNYSRISVGNVHICGITTSGSLKCWGWNNNGQIGDGTTTQRLTPTVIESGTSYKDISSGDAHTCGVTAAGVIRCWGANGFGQLGDNSTAQSLFPKTIDSGTSYLKISTKLNHTCGLTTIGELKCWGDNSLGQLGDGTIIQRLTPTLIDSGVSYSSISSGYKQTCGITNIGELKCWGYNLDGRLGDGSLTNRPTPTLIDNGVTYSYIASGGNHICGITATGALKCWGDNSYGQLGDGMTLTRLTPFVIDATTTTYTTIDSGSVYGCAMTASGVWKCWGDNSFGQLGDGTLIPRLILAPTSNTITYTRIVSGDVHSCGITSQGALHCWGDNSYGQIGDGTTTVRLTPTLIDSGTAYSQVEIGNTHTCGITTAGTLKCWGDNSYGQLGDTTNTIRLLPTLIDSGTSYSRVAAGSQQSCAITSTGALKCWGGNTRGEVGDGTVTPRSSPVLIDSGTNYTKIVSGDRYNCGITSTGALKCWGRNTNYQIGDGTLFTRNTPTLIDSGISYTQITAGYTHTCGITTTGILKCWGSNFYGYLGDGTTSQRSTPKVIDSGVSYLDVSNGAYHTCGVTSSNLLKCWGYNLYGQIGDGTYPPHWLPHPIVGVRDVDNTPPTVTLTGAPTGTSNTTVLSVLVGGFDVVQYKYKVGETPTTDCSSSAGYSAALNINTSPLITDIISALADGSITLCAVGRDTAGNWQTYATATTATWIKSFIGYDATAVATLSGLPSSVDSTTALNVTVGGNAITHYRYKLGLEASTDCSVFAGYGSELPIATLITDSLFGYTDGTRLKICAIGSKGGSNNNYQPLSSATTHSWTKDTVIEANITYLGESYNDANTAMSFNVSIPSSKPYDVSLGYRVYGDAVPTTDHSLTNGQVTIPAGQTSATVNYNLLHNLATTAEKTFNVQLNQSSKVGVALGILSYQFNSIKDVDAGPYSDLLQVSTGNLHSCGITTTGVLKCWGSNTNSRLGDGTTIQRNIPTIIDSGTTYAKIAAGFAHTCGITTTGALKCWGWNSYGQLGDGTTTTRNTPTIIDFGTSYSQISVGNAHTCGITSSGILKCWGANTVGQIGDGTTTTRTTPTIIDPGIVYTKVASGSNHNCGITAASTLNCWGINSSRQLGDNTTTDRLIPTLIDSGVAYTQITAGNSHTCAITAATANPANALKCWGYNLNGRLGDGTSTTRSIPTLIDSGTSYSGISAGGSHTCGITSADNLKCWGWNSYGQLGDDTMTDRTLPTVVASGSSYSQVSSGGSHTCGITRSGTLKCWGYNSNGQLGDNSKYLVQTPTDVDSSVTYDQISAFGEHNCAITSATANPARALKCWGPNSQGYLGDGTLTDHTIPTQADAGTTYTHISSGINHNCGITTAGALKCWGYNGSGQLGDGTGLTRLTPTLIDSGTAYMEVSCGQGHTCAITVSGVLKCWGWNSNNQLGDGTTNNRSNPIVIDSGTSYAHISSGNFYTCGITTDGHIKCWGDNFNGQLGDGTTTNKTSPTLIDGANTYTQVSAGYIHTCAINTAGKLFCWGANSNGQIGDGTTTQRTSPTPIDSSQTYIQSASSNTFHTCGITSAGALKCWGQNTYGQLGDGTTTQRTTPTLIDSGISYTKIATGSMHVCGIISSGQMKCWGSPIRGRIGDGTYPPNWLPHPIVGVRDVDNTPPEVTLSGAPSGTTNTTTLAVTVGGFDVIAYKYKVGLTASTDCSVSGGYSAIINMSTTSMISDSIAALADGGITLCAVGRDTAGNWQTYATATSATWTKDTAEPLAALAGAPTGTSNTVTLDIDVGGTNVTAYRYKISAGTNDCANPLAYSAEQSAALNITDTISALADGTIYVCALAKNSLGTWQTSVNATVVSWAKDTVAPTTTITGAPAGTNNTTITNITIGGTDVDTYEYKLAAGTDDCTGAYGSGFLTVSTAIINDISSLADGNVYLCVRGKDTAGNVQGTATSTSWTKDTAPPTATITGAPVGTNNTTVLNADIGGAGVVAYKYKVGLTTSTDCTVSGGYSAETTESTNITSDISALADGAVTLCVIGKDGAGNWQTEAAASTATWTKDTTDATAMATLLGLPASVDSATTLGVTVGGTAIVAYRYKVGLSGSVDCSTLSGYSSEVVIATQITDNLAGYTNGDQLTLCVIGSKTGGYHDYQPLASATSYSWIKDTVIEANITYLGESYNDANTAMSFGVQLASTKPYDVTLDYRSYGVATSSTDHDLPLTGQVTIPAGQTTATVNFNLLRNLAVNAEKTFNIQLTQSSKVGVVPGALAYQLNSIKDVDGGAYTDVVKVSTGNFHACAITSVGVLKCWGYNGNGQLGDGTTTQRNTPVTINSGTSYSQISSGQYHTCGITTTGALHCWGYNSSGQLGDGTTNQRTTPGLIDSGTSYTKISAGTNHTCGITTSGVLKCWGRNDYGQLGDTTTTWRLAPVTIDSGIQYTEVAAGGNQSCAITTLGALKCWGYNFAGEVGDGTNIQRQSPVLIDSGTSYTKISAGYGQHTCGITSTGAIKCWGGNSYGELGDGTGNYSSVPVLIEAGISYSEIDTGYSHTCGITSSGTLKCWGGLYIFSPTTLGDGKTFYTFSPVIIDSGNSYIRVSGSVSNTCGITAAGTLKCWGKNKYGQVGDGNQDILAVPTIVNSGTSYSEIKAGSAQTCGISTIGGSLKCWGDNLYGQLGDGGAIARRASPFAINSGTSYIQISSLSSHTCGITSTGTLKCWGNNVYRQLGDGTQTTRLAPVSIDLGVNYTQISNGDRHGCGITSTGVLKCWGENTYGQLGDNTTTQRSVPTLVDAGVSYTQISSGSNHTCGITSTGVLKCWGRNLNSSLGDGTTTNRLVPTVIDSGTSYTQISAGALHTCGITSTGVLKCWGNNTYYRLGDNTITQRSVPTLIDSGTSYTKISAGSTHTCGITSTGALKCWGDNTSSQLGDNTTTQRTVPTLIDSGTSYTKISAGSAHTCGITSSGALKCWGDNGNGQVGVDTYAPPWLPHPVVGVRDVDGTPPIVTLTGAPTGTNNSTILSVTVGGVDVVSYKYKVGVTGSTDCTVSSGYSAAIAVATIPTITDSLTALADGGITLCAVGRDTAGNWQTYATATSATWTKDTAEPVATLAGAPTGTSNTVTLNIDVGGTNVTAYRYKISAGTNDCANPLAYSAEQSAALNITDTISALADGTIYVCALAKNSLGTWQTSVNATVVSWTKDTVAPTATIIGAPAGTNNTTITNITIGGTDVDTYEYKLAAGTEDCSGAYGSGFVTVSTAIINDISSFTDGNVYLCVRGKDTAGNVQGTTTSTSWTKDTAPPTATITGAPVGKNNTTSINIDIGGTELVTYKYKLDLTASIDCSLSAGYSAETTESTNITSDISSLADGSITLCVVGKDSIGNWQTNATATTTAWTKDTFAPMASLTGLPLSIDATATLSITVGGTSITHYRYKVGLASSTDCSSLTGYSAERAIGTLITDSIAAYANDTRLTICAIGSIGGGGLNYQDPLMATAFTWIKDAVIEANISYLGESYDDANSAMQFNVTIPSTKPYDVVFNYRVFGNSITGTDHNLSNGQVTIAAGLLSATVNYNFLRNIDLTQEKTFNIQITKTSKPGVAAGPLAYQFNSIKDVDGSLYSNGIEISSGSDHTCTIITGGTIKCWGPNGYGQIGDGTYTSRTIPTLIDSGTTYSKISNGNAHTCGITTTGSLKCWGANFYGQLGDGTLTNRTTPTLIDGTNTYKEIDAGTNYTCGITTTDTLKCWGYNLYGQLGDGTTTNTASPILIDGLNFYSKIAAGGGHTCGITTTGILKCWGQNANGQVGDGTLIQVTTPSEIDSITSYAKVTAGDNHTCAITTTGSLKCWGANINGQVGNSTTTDQTIPIVINSPNTYSEITTGGSHTCGIRTSGSLRCWGNNFDGQLGDGTITNRTAPVLIDSGNTYLRVTTGFSHTCGITSSGSIKCWGLNLNGQLGDGGTSNYLSPISPDPTTTYSKVSSGRYHTCGITNSGLRKCWGHNAYAEVGDGSTTYRPTPTLFDFGTTYTKISSHRYSTCGITPANTIHCWGSNSNYQLGDDTVTSRRVPVFIDSGTRFTDIANGSYHTCGITTTGNVKCWGLNTSGQLGDGTTTQRTTPTPIDSGTKYKVISSGESHTCGITTTGVLKCWGNNVDGRIGDGTTTNQLTPIPIDSGTTYVAISTGYYSTCGITNTGALKCWGWNGSAQLGDGTTTSRPLPTPIDAGTSYSKISHANGHSCGITTSGVLKCWGFNGDGRVGDGTIINRGLPVVIDVGVNYSEISAGRYHTCGITSNGTLKCWGSNTDGQLGYDDHPSHWLPHPIVGIREP